jgi:hypothetical protein
VAAVPVRLGHLPGPPVTPGPRGAVVGLCHCCDRPVRAGDERREVIEHGTSAGPDILLHRGLCRPRSAR